MDLWLPAWFRRSDAGLSPLGARHLLLCVCDHFEPFGHGATPAQALERIDLWLEKLLSFAEFRDERGETPRHTFFYPAERYEVEVVSRLAALCHATGNETELLLHHEGDTAAKLRETLLLGKERLSTHGLLSRDEAGEIRYGFVHGSGALDNSHPHGRHCGVSNELGILAETGCYADFTMPSAPHRTQTRIINSLYYARCTPAAKSHDSGHRVRAAREPSRRGSGDLLMVQGPLAPDWQRRKWGLFPRVENGGLTATNPPTAERLQLWLDCRIAVQGRPNWLFVKLHTHGASQENARMLLGEPMRAFHRLLAQMASQDPTFHFHYVSAREMVNILHAAEAGHSGDPGNFRDFRYRRLSQLSGGVRA